LFAAATALGSDAVAQTPDVVRKAPAQPRPAAQPVAPRLARRSLPVGPQPTAIDAIRMAEASLQAMRQIADYSCTLVKRERIDGRLTGNERLAIKLRHEPFSVYVNYLAPAKVRGQEAVYVHGHNDNRLLAHPNGLKGRLVGVFRLDPEGRMAMQGNRYPVTDLGIKRMAESWLKEAKHDVQFVHCTTRIIPDAKIEGRPCTCLELARHTRHDGVPYQMTRLYIDAQMQLPVRYEAYEWPAIHGEEPDLAEEYTYLNIQPNRQFSDLDFDVQNPEYEFH
jgi:hypothetical protein